MKVPSDLIPVLKELVHELVIRNYTGLESDGRAGRLTAKELERTIAQYGRTLAEIPDGAFEASQAYPIKGDEASWAIDLDLWTTEEGKSDLTLLVTAHTAPDRIAVEIDDLHVL